MLDQPSLAQDEHDPDAVDRGEQRVPARNRKDADLRGVDGNDGLPGDQHAAKDEDVAGKKATEHQDVPEMDQIRQHGAFPRASSASDATPRFAGVGCTPSVYTPPRRRPMLRSAATLLIAVGSMGLAGAQAPYYPERFNWRHGVPAEMGMSIAALDAAVNFAIANENTAPRDLALAHAASLGAEPFDTPIGPHKNSCGRQRADHPPRDGRRRVGRHESRRHDVQRDQDLSVDRVRHRPGRRASSAM